MKKIIITILSIIMTTSLLVSCNSEKGEKDGENSSAVELFEENQSEGNEGSISFAPDLTPELLESEETLTFDYTGKEMKIPYRITGEAEGITSKFGLIVFVDGIPQPYKIEKDKKKSAEDYMHNFNLEFKQEEKFNIVFDPIVGKKGEKLAVTMATILRPDYLPESLEKYTSYGIYNSLAANLPVVLNYKSSAKSKESFKTYNKVNYEKISKEIKEYYNSITPSYSEDYFDRNIISEISGNTDNENLITFEKNKKLKVQFKIWGGLEANYRTTFFVNHKPIKIEDCEYIEIKTKKDNIAVAEIEIDTQNLKDLNTIYAISMPYGEDYKKEIDFPIKTISKLLAVS